METFCIPIRLKRSSFLHLEIPLPVLTLLKQEVMILALEFHFASDFSPLSILHWFQSQLPRRRCPAHTHRYRHTERDGTRVSCCSSVLALALDATRPAVIHHLLPASSWGTGAALAAALRNQLKTERTVPVLFVVVCVCVCVLRGAVLACGTLLRALFPSFILLCDL